jgi:hypothetical protein
MKPIEDYSKDWIIALFQHYLDGKGDVFENKDLMYEMIRNFLLQYHSNSNHTDGILVDSSTIMAKWTIGESIDFDGFFDAPELIERKLVSPNFDKSAIQIGESVYAIHNYVLMKTLFENNENELKIYNCGEDSLLLFESGRRRGVLAHLE